MSGSRNYIFLDSIFADYMNHYGKEWENKLVEEFKTHLSSLSKNSEIMIITQQNLLKVNDWLLKYDLLQFIDNISNPLIC